MPKRFVCFILIFVVSASALGESLHALPVFEHHGAEVCESASTHFDAVDLNADSKCVLCEALVEFYGTPVPDEPPFDLVTAERSVLPARSIDAGTVIYVSGNRGPPGNSGSQSRNMDCS